MMITAVMERPPSSVANISPRTSMSFARDEGLGMGISDNPPNFYMDRVADIAALTSSAILSHQATNHPSPILSGSSHPSSYPHRSSRVDGGPSHQDFSNPFPSSFISLGSTEGETFNCNKAAASEPSQSYVFPPPTRSDSTSTVMPDKERRPSYLPSSPRTPRTANRPGSRGSRRSQHEIDPPSSRRLSSHQMLLLTPFGGPGAAGVLAAVTGRASRSGSIVGEGSSTGMSRTNTNFPGTSMPLRSAVQGNPQESSRIGPGIGMGPGAPRITSSGLARPRPRSLTHTTSAASPSSALASAPMTTILSASDSSDAEGEVEDAMDNGGDLSIYPARLGDHLTTVPMMRSTSSPVMSLQTLEALKRRDGELGIVRGGMWAWVSHDVPEDVCGESEQSPKAAANTRPASGAMSRAPAMAPVMQPNAPSGSSHPRPPAPSSGMFRDPFAVSPSVESSGSSVMSRAYPITPSNSSYPQAINTDASATASDYHYNPQAGDGRRMSAAPIPTAGQAAKLALASKDARRPSVPLNVFLQGSKKSHFVPPSSLQKLADEPEPPAPADDQDQEIDVPAAASTCDPRPVHRLQRYRSLPDRRLSLSFALQDPSADAEQRSQSQRSSFSTAAQRRQSAATTVTSGDRNRTSSVTSLRPHAAGVQSARERSLVSGVWAAVDVLDTLTAPNSPPISPASSLDEDTTASASAANTTGPGTATVTPNPVVATLASDPSRRKDSKSTSSTASASPRRVPFIDLDPDKEYVSRRRFDSVDSALPLSAVARFQGDRRGSNLSGVAANYSSLVDGRGAGLQVTIGPLSETDWNTSFPRRGSLVVLTNATLVPWTGSERRGSKV